VESCLAGREDGVLVEEGLGAAVSRWELSRHPFWKDWQAGAVPAAGLTAVARELEAFLPLLQAGWEAVNDLDTADLAFEEAELWHRFSQVARRETEVVHISQSDELRTLTRSLFLKDPTALGALYAVNAQLPFICTQLQDGLERFHPTEAEVAQPFCAHVLAHKLAEVALAYHRRHTPEQQAAAAEAAGREAQALWQLFTGIHASYG
jgi:hypothetical protein